MPGVEISLSKAQSYLALLCSGLMKRRGRKSRYWYYETRATSQNLPKTGIRGSAFGTTWWGAKWLEAMDDISDSNRLPRGRTYARNGSVLAISFTDNQISATVVGSSKYQVELSFPPFRPAEKRKIIELVQSNPILSSDLINRVLPPELYTLLAEHGIDVFPTGWSSFSATCSCPDWALPCKHLAAVFYLIAEEIDKNPQRVFLLRGLDLNNELIQEGGGLSGPLPGTIVHFADMWQPIIEKEPQPFIPEKEALAALDFTRIPVATTLLPRLLADRPLFYAAGDFKQEYGKIIRRIAQKVPSLRPEPSTITDAQRRSYLAAAIVEVTLADSSFPCEFAVWDDQEELQLDARDSNTWNTWLSQVPLDCMEQLSFEVQGVWLTWCMAHALVAKGAIVPQLLTLEDGRYAIRWLPANMLPEVRELTRALSKVVTQPVVNMRGTDGTLFEPESGHFAETLLAAMLTSWVHEAAKDLGLAEVSPMVRFFFGGEIRRFDRFEDRDYPAGISVWLQRFFLTDQPLTPVLQFEEEEVGVFKMELGVLYKRELMGTPQPLTDYLQGKVEIPPRDKQLLLNTLSLLAGVIPEMRQLLLAGKQSFLSFSGASFVRILEEVLPLVRLLGVPVALPRSLNKILRPSLGLRIDSNSQQSKGSGLLGLQKLLTYSWEIALGDTQISKEEFTALLHKSEGLVKFRDAYIILDPQEIKKLTEALQKPPALAGMQLVQAALTEDYLGVPVVLTPALRKVIDELLALPDIAVPVGIQASLRPYQERGFSWLYKNAKLGLGSILADDMGLGKTIQVITALQQWKNEGSLGIGNPALVVAPTSLLTNWEREVAKFAPGLLTAVFHGNKRSLQQALKSSELIITSYGHVRTDSKELKKHSWQVLILDESQQIKNPGTAQTKAIKTLPATIRIAMSGTPVENRLREYWSVLDFTNPGLLGSLKGFERQFARPIELQRDHLVLERFHRLTRPFVLRRLKSDKSIIKDLPDKVVSDQYCRLSPEQAALYQEVVNATLEKISEAEGISRRGLVLQLIIWLKQICNHPAHYVTGTPLKVALSGKSEQLIAIMTEAQEAGEKVLIFTQFKQMGILLQTMLKEELHIDIPFLHGGVSRSRRDEMVTNFQSKRTIPAMIISLKAGGTGLNLTAASQVIHYDLWWNPAVEDQATDRAYRIGQERKVLVHRLISSDTFEERINDMIVRKKSLANITVGSGETWIGDLPDQELRAIFAYSPE